VAGKHGQTTLDRRQRFRRGDRWSCEARSSQLMGLECLGGLVLADFEMHAKARRRTLLAADPQEIRKRSAKLVSAR
jgi:hypothetical protein